MVHHLSPKAAGADLERSGAREPDEATPLLSGRKGFPAHFVGAWRCKDGDFYEGSIIEIGDHHWYPLRPKAAVHKGATYTWNACDGWYELTECRAPNDQRTFKLREGPDGTLEVSICNRVWHLVSQTESSRKDLGSPSDKSFTDLVTPRAVSDVVKEAVTATRVPPVFLIISFALLVLCFFMLIFVEEWHVLTSLYVVAQCVLTIGFGDFQVTHDVTKLSLSFLMICSLVLVAFVANTVCDAVVARHFASAADRMTEFQSELLEQVNEHRQAGATVETRIHTPKRTDEQSKNRCAKLLVGIFPALCCLGFGTVFYATYEACTCSYGRSRKPECSMESYQTCVDTGGYVKTWVDAFYMSVMALTTVGIGDFSPRSEFGRGVAIIWMIFGVASTGYMIRELSEFLFEQRREKLMEADILSISREAFEIIDSDGDGHLSKTEWRLFILLKHNLVRQQVLDDIDMAFDELAAGRDTIDFSDIQKHQDESFKVKRSTPRLMSAPAACSPTKSPLSPDSDIV